MANETAKQRLRRRAKKAEEINKALKRLFSASMQQPDGKITARFIDRIKKIQTRAHNLAWDLARDVEVS